MSLQGLWQVALAGDVRIDPGFSFVYGTCGEFSKIMESGGKLCVLWWSDN